MNLHEKDQLDFTDAHLWAEGSRFVTSIEMANLHSFRPLLMAFEVRLMAHQRDGDDNYNSVAFLMIRAMHPDITKHAMDLAVGWLKANGKRVRFEYNGQGVETDYNLVIKERWDTQPLEL